MTDTIPAAAEGMPKIWKFEFGDSVRFDGTDITGVVRGRSEIEYSQDRFLVRFADARGIPTSRWARIGEIMKAEG